MWFTYLLLCQDNSIYAGVTNDLEKRLAAHRAGTASRYTRSRGSRKFIYAEKAANKSAALKREHALKKLDRAAKLVLVKGFKLDPKIKLPK